MLLYFLSFFLDLQSAHWDDEILHGLDFIEHSVLNLPFFLMTFLRHFSPAMDNMFMESLQWVDQTYIQKHKSEDPSHLRAMYYPNLVMYPAHGSDKEQKSPMDAMIATLSKYGRKGAISLAVFALSFVPYVGRFVLPAASFYTFNKAVGIEPAIAIFGAGIFLPRRYLVTFLQSYFASRSLMRELVSLLIVSRHRTICANNSSSTPTSNASVSRRSRNVSGSTIEKASCLASLWPSGPSSRSRS